MTNTNNHPYHTETGNLGIYMAANKHRGSVIMRNLRPCKLVKAQSAAVDDAEVWRRMRRLDKEDLSRRIGQIDDPFLRDRARRLAAACYVV